MRKILIILIFVLLAVLPSSARRDGFTVLQWNIWQEGTVVKNGYDAIVDEIARLQPDFVTLSEVRNYDDTRFCDRITESLLKRGHTYYSFYSYDTGLLSRYPIEDSLTVFPCVDDHGSIYGLRTHVGRHKVAVYTAHLDYLNDSYYEARGYDGNTFQPITPITDSGTLLYHGERSRRDEAIAAFLWQARRDTRDGYTVILGGDLNEPSFHDWTEATADLYDHHGAVVEWPQTRSLEADGFTDCYRSLYPDVLTHPGFTYPCDNLAAPVNKLTWAPLADERERIDYIFYRAAPRQRLQLVDCRIFGPEGCIMRSLRHDENTGEPRILPLGLWPTDHKGVWSEFEFK